MELEVLNIPDIAQEMQTAIRSAKKMLHPLVTPADINIQKAAKNPMIPHPIVFELELSERKSNAIKLPIIPNILSKHPALSDYDVL